MVMMTARMLEMERRYFAAHGINPIAAYDSRGGLSRDEEETIDEVVERFLRALKDRGLSLSKLEAVRGVLKESAHDFLASRRAEDEPEPFEGRPRSGGTVEGDRRRAMDDVRGVLQAHDCLAYDSADAIYRVALRRIGVDPSGIHPSALRDVFRARHDQRRHGGAAPRLATDATAAKGFAERFPGAGDILISY